MRTTWRLASASGLMTLCILTAHVWAAAPGGTPSRQLPPVFPAEPLRPRVFPPEIWTLPPAPDTTEAEREFDARRLRSWSLAGPWKFRLDPNRVGLKENWPTTELAESINLPGTTDQQRQGVPNTNTKLTNHLSRAVPYSGAAWYQRAVNIPDTWKDKRVVLSLERTKSTQIWVDGKVCGEQDTLAAPQLYDLSSVLTPGQHRLTVLVDNAKPLPVNGGHQLSEDTQTNWNGILGHIELHATDRVWIDDVQAYPDVKNHQVKVRLTLGNVSGSEASGTITIEVSRRQASAPPRRMTATQAFTKTAHGAVVEAVCDLGSDVQLWDEFAPNLYSLTATLEATACYERARHSQAVAFGMREFTTRGSQFAINGRTTFLRGKHEACVFPLTGYAPMDVSGWYHVLRIAKLYGINHYRFHSWCPPEAAFTAADILGMYLQPELPNFGGDLGKNTAAAEFSRAEGRRILKAYGNHPSFVMFALGNEMFGGREVRADILRDFRKLDPRHLYAQASNYEFSSPQLAAGDDYWTTFRTRPGADGAVRGSYAHVDAPLGHVQAGPAATTFDFSKALVGVPVPVIGHEVGQYQTYPNFREIEKYRGVLKAWNFEVFRERLRAAGMLDQADAFVKASGALSVICYREDIEAALRTKGFGGFQLLDLQDFPGQGTALVGILDAFMDSKGLIEPPAWREFCCETVPLVLLPKYTWTTGENLTAEIKVAHYGPAAIPGAVVSWNLADADGKSLAAGKLPAKDLPQGSLVELGSLGVPLQGVSAPAKLKLTAQLDGTEYRNRYDLWVYAERVDTAVPAGVTVSRKLDAPTLQTLTSGGKVVLLPEPAELSNGVDGFFAADFWCYPMFKGGHPPGTLGLLCDPQHAALALFPSEFHSNWQWFHLVLKSRAVILDEAPAAYRPLVQVIDNFDRNHKLGLLSEARVGTGKLLVCTIDLPALQDRPEARQLLASLLAYASSDRFQPKSELTANILKKVLASPAANLARGKPATASSSQAGEGHTPDRALDGSRDTRWCAADATVEQWWQVDLQTPQDLSGCEIIWEQDGRRYQYQVGGSIDGQNWTTLSDQRLQDQPKQLHELKFSASAVRFVRITVTGLEKGAWASIREVRVFAPEKL